MNIMTKLSIIWHRMIQRVGFGGKTYNSFHPLPINDPLKRKGHFLRNPSKDQIKGIYEALLKQIKADQWTIGDLEGSLTDGRWERRPLDVIDKIVIGATDSVAIDSSKLYEYDTDDWNAISDTRLPGIHCHIFINHSGFIEKTSDFANITMHTPGYNTRSIFIVLQYAIKDNNSAPPKKMLNALERVLTVLCMQFKLDPYKAIVPQNIWSQNIFFKLNKFLKGNRLLLKSPGPLVPIESLRYETAVKIQKKLRYAKLYKGEINGEFNRETKKGLNAFKSEAFNYLYNKLMADKIR